MRNDMFNLEQSIAEWRRQMVADGIQAGAVLDELASHLRDDIEQQRRSGASAKIAFENATRRIGPAGVLRQEFAKVDDLERGLRWKIRSALSKFLGVPLVLPENFTFNAREILECGRQEALGFHHDFIGTEHVLLGLLKAETGMVPKVLQKMGVSHEIVRAEIEKRIGPGSQCEITRPPPYTPRAKKALELAFKEARALKRRQINAGHIFLGLLSEGSGVAALVLNSLGINTARAREEILKEFGNQKELDE